MLCVEGVLAGSKMSLRRNKDIFELCFNNRVYASDALLAQVLLKALRLSILSKFRERTMAIGLAYCIVEFPGVLGRLTCLVMDTLDEEASNLDEVLSEIFEEAPTTDEEAYEALKDQVKEDASDVDIVGLLVAYGLLVDTESFAEGLHELLQAMLSEGLLSESDLADEEDEEDEGEDEEDEDDDGDDDDDDEEGGDDDDDDEEGGDDEDEESEAPDRAGSKWHVTIK